MFKIKGIVTRIENRYTNSGVPIREITLFLREDLGTISPCFLGDKIKLTEGIEVENKIEVTFKIKKSKGIHNVIGETIKIV